MTIKVFSDSYHEDGEMGGGPTHPAYPGLFLWLSVNKIQLFSALQMQPPSVCLCNKPCTPSGPRYIQRTKREVKPSLLSGSSYQHPAHQAPPRPISPPCCPLRETTPALTSHILLTQPTLPRFLEGDLPPCLTDCGFHKSLTDMGGGKYPTQAH